MTENGKKRKLKELTRAEMEQVQGGASPTGMGLEPGRTPPFLPEAPGTKNQCAKEMQEMNMS